MSTLRVSNIEAKADVSSPTVDEKIKFTNSSGDVLFHLDGKTSGITTVGINTTGNTFTVNNTTGDVSFSGSVTSSGVSTFTSDVSIADKIVHIGDTNTAIRFPSADTITAETGGSERLRITSSGNVGIGTDNPPAKLSVDGSVIFGNTTSSGLGGTLRIVESGNSVYIQPGSNTSNDSSCDLIISSTNGVTEKLRITSTGNVGLGVSPESWGTNFRAFQIGSTGSLASQVGARTIELATNAYNNSGWKYTDSDVASLYYQYNGEHIFSNAPSGTDDASISFAERLRITSDGNIGVGGIITPTFTTGGGIHLADAYGIGFGNGANGRPDFQIVYDTGQNNGLQIRCGNGADTADVYFTTAGNLAFASGQGIDFSAASGSAAGSTSALLDDYEEGIFSPTAYGSTTAGTTTYGLQYGTYVKIGNLCHFQVRMNVSNMTGTGGLRFGGLPFTAFNDSERGYGSVAVGYLSSLPFADVADTLLALYTNANTTHIVVRSSGNNRASADVPVDTAFTILYGGTYRTT